MKVKIVATEIVEIHPEDFREINDEGKEGPIPSNENIVSMLRNLELEYVFEYFNDPDIEVEEV